MLKKDEEKGVFYITKNGEVLFWLLLILLFVMISSSTFMFKEKHDENDYQIFLQDVDGLIVGSPVRMMGIEVGYVTKIKPAGDEVYVKFVLTNPEVYIPQGSEITVEFSGMAGSKSLELYLPDKNSYIEKNMPVITVNPPKRLHDALGLLNDMFKKIGSIMYATSSFGTKLEQTGISSVKTDTKKTDYKDFLKFADKFLDDSKEKTSQMRNSIKGLGG